MHVSLAAFSDELTKVAGTPAALVRRSVLSSDDDATVNTLVHAQTHHGKNYARSMAIGAVIAPVMTVLTRSLGRFIHNRGVMRAVARQIESAPKAKLLSELRTGPMFGRSFGHSAGRSPVMSYADLGADVFSGAMGGSIVQAVRDKLGD